MDHGFFFRNVLQKTSFTNSPFFVKFGTKSMLTQATRDTKICSISIMKYIITTEVRTCWVKTVYEHVHYIFLKNITLRYSCVLSYAFSAQA
jgi:hypothetical protein